jgi:hypothetical protein
MGGEPSVIDNSFVAASAARFASMPPVLPSTGEFEEEDFETGIADCGVEEVLRRGPLISVKAAFCFLPKLA